MSKFVKDLVERAVSSSAGGALVAVGADSLDVVGLDWKQVLGFAAGAGLVSVLKCLAAFKFVEGGDGSFLKTGR